MCIRDRVKETLYWFASDYSETMLEKNMRATFDWEEDFALRIIMDSDLSDLRYLYRFGEYISENELHMARYLNSLPEEKIALMADTCLLYTSSLPYLHRGWKTTEKGKRQGSFCMTAGKGRL